MSTVQAGKTRLTILVCIIAGLMLLILGALPMLTARTLQQVYQTEMKSIYKVTGIVIRNHPELEAEIAGALKNDDAAILAAGQTVIEKYGYEIDRDWQQNEHYQGIFRGYLYWFLLFLLLLAAGNGAVIYWQGKKFKLREEDMVATLEHYIKGDFSGETAIDRVGRSGDLLQQFGRMMQITQNRLEEEKENIKSLITDISHQLKTPIASLKTCFELYSETEDEAERSEFKERSILQIHQLERLTGSLIQISRLENAMITLAPVPCALQELLASAVSAVYPKAAMKNIMIVSNTDEQELAQLIVTVDPRWTTEAIINVLDNGVKYSPPGSIIEIKTHKLFNFIRIEIKDEGIGLSKEDFVQIYQRFYRGKHPLVRASEGSGVGLYLTRMILERQGGGIWAVLHDGHNQIEEKGTTFILQLRL